MSRRKRTRSPHAVTIATVAERAGVSVATVSRVMNGVPTVDEALAERVQQAASEMGYRPNVMAQGLARGSLKTVGVVVPNLANPYFYQILKAIEASARRNNFRMLTADSDEDPDEEYAICEWLSTQVDCLILCSPRMDTPRLESVKNIIPKMVVTNRFEEDLSIAAVCSDSSNSVRKLATHLWEHGHRSAVYLAGPSLSWAMRERLRSLEANDLEISTIPCGGTIEDGYRILPDALGRNPTAIIAFNDLVAFGALARLKELGVSVPDEISVAGFDDIPFSKYGQPSLTSIHNPLELIGSHGWELIHEQMNGEAATKVIRVPSHLIIRESTGRARDRAEL